MAGPAVLTVADTIARSFLLAVQTRGDRPAIREKKFGIWQPTSWREWLQISKDIAFGLHATVFRPGDVASIIANAVPEWVYADMGILCAGGVSSGIYPTDSAAQVEYLVNDSQTRVMFVEDEEQLDKVLTCRSRCPTLEKIVGEGDLPCLLVELLGGGLGQLQNALEDVLEGLLYDRNAG